MLRLLGVSAETAVGIDISREMLVLARSNLHAAGLDHLSVRQGNMYQLRFADGSFDTVTIDQVLYQAEQPAEVLREAARVLRPGGRLLLVEFLTGTARRAAPPAEETRSPDTRWRAGANSRAAPGSFRAAVGPAVAAAGLRRPSPRRAARRGGLSRGSWS
jgi:SAM-dependent methyltransferase